MAQNWHSEYNHLMAKTLLSRLSLQEELYAFGQYLLDEYKSFSIHTSVEYFEGRHGKHKDHLLPHKYRGITKYYFFVKETNSVDEIGETQTLAHYQWRTFSDPYDWYCFLFGYDEDEHIYHITAYDTLVGLAYASQTFIEWEARYLEENPNFKRRKDTPESEALYLCRKYSLKDKRNLDYLRDTGSMTEYYLIHMAIISGGHMNKLPPTDISLDWVKDYTGEDNLLTRGVKIAPSTSPPMTHKQMETIIKKLYVNVNKPYYFDCLREVIRRKNGGTLNSMENEMVDVHFIRPCENDKGLYISYLLHELFFKRRTENIFLERDSEKT